ncbi:MAG: hypothetical protein ACT4QC_06640 [Planctomycetaceae bacterium]
MILRALCVLGGCVGGINHEGHKEHQARQAARLLVNSSAAFAISCSRLFHLVRPKAALHGKRSEFCRGNNVFVGVETQLIGTSLLRSKE